jgi:hypothetical protein
MPYHSDFAPPVSAQLPAADVGTAAVPSSQVFTSDSTQPTGVTPVADPTVDDDTDTDPNTSVIVEAAQNGDVTVAATAMPGTTVVSLPATTFTNGLKYEVCFFAPRVERTTVTGSIDTCKITLVDGGTNNDPWARLVVPASVSGGSPVFLRSHFVGDGASHTYVVVAYCSFANEFVVGTGGDQIQLYARYLGI